MATNDHIRTGALLTQAVTKANILLRDKYLTDEQKQDIRDIKRFAAMWSDPKHDSAARTEEATIRRLCLKILNRK